LIVFFTAGIHDDDGIAELASLDCMVYKIHDFLVHFLYFYGDFLRNQGG